MVVKLESSGSQGQHPIGAGLVQNDSIGWSGSFPLVQVTYFGDNPPVVRHLLSDDIRQQMIFYTQEIDYHLNTT